MCVSLTSHASIADYVFIGSSTLVLIGCVCAAIATIRALILDARNRKILAAMKGIRHAAKR